MIKIKQRVVILSIFLTSMMIVGFAPLSYAQSVTTDLSMSDPEFFTIDLSVTPNTLDFPYDVVCDDPTFDYVGLYEQGSIAKVDRLTNVTTIYDINTSTNTGEDVYSLQAANNKIFGNTKDLGLVYILDTTNFSTSKIPVVEDVSNGVVSYPQGYTNAPNIVNIAGVGQHIFSFNSLGELIYTNGYVWELLDYTYDFSVAENNAGAVDTSFHGLVRIDPSNNSVTRISINGGASALRGVTIDSQDSKILWITDISNDKLFRFDTNTNSVTNVYNLPSGSSPRGITSNGDKIYIAANKASGGNSEIIVFDKLNNSTQIIDTGATNTNGGTFAVLVVNNAIFWTDESKHVGIVEISNYTNTIIKDTTGETSTNHFGCVRGNEVTFVGHGSAKVGTLSVSGGTSTSESSHGDSCKGDCYSPFLGNDENNKHFYDDGLTILSDGFKRVFEIKNVLHNLGNETISLPVSKPVTFILKAQDSYPDNISSCEVAIGIEHGHFVKQDATYILGVKRSFDGIVSQYTEGDHTAFKDYVATMTNVDPNVYANFTWVPTKHLTADMFALECKDTYFYSKTYFVNHGVEFIGISEVGTPVYIVTDSQNGNRLVVITTVDKTLENLDEAVDNNGNLWHRDNANGLWYRDFIRPDMSCSGTNRECVSGQHRLILEQQIIAEKIFNSSEIQSKVANYISIPFTEYGRTHDSIPNMSKAYAEYAASHGLNKSSFKFD